MIIKSKIDHFFCEKCEKIVPQSEVSDTFNTGILKHKYYITKNYYGNLRPGAIAYSPISHLVVCGSVREPTALEYFIHHTCR